MPPVKKQPALSRKQKAQATRQRMMRAAYERFSELGYAATTMDAIAERAGVAVQTLYFTFHTKAELLRAAIDFAVLGEQDPVPPPLTPWHRAAEAAPTVDEALPLLVAGTAEIIRRVAPLTAVIRADADARVAQAHNEQLRVEGYRNMVAFLRAKQPLRQGVTPKKALDVMLTLLGPELYLVLTADRGWSHAAYVSWVGDVLHRELFG